MSWEGDRHVKHGASVKTKTLRMEKYDVPEGKMNAKASLCLSGEREGSRELRGIRRMSEGSLLRAERGADLWKRTLAGADLFTALGIQACHGE